MDRAGVNFRGQLLGDSPAAFVLGFFLSRPTLWLLGNMLVYRLKFRNFMITQPLILLASIPGEHRACSWAAHNHPEVAATAFNAVATWARSVFSSPAARHALANAPPGDALATCCKVHGLVTLVLGLVTPGLVIWQLEQRMWREFARRPAETLTWRGGPSAGQLAAAQAALRSKQGAPLRFDGRLVAVGFVLAATAWQLLDALI